MRFVAAFAFSVIPMLSSAGGSVGAPEPLAAAAQADQRAPLDVDFAGCREVANAGLAPTANIRPLVPAQFTLVESADPTMTEHRGTRGPPRRRLGGRPPRASLPI